MNNFKMNTLSLVAATALLLTGCGDKSSTTTVAAVPNCDASLTVLDSVISSSLTLDSTKTYGLDGKVNVSSGAVLTVPAGTTIAGCTPSSFMVVEPGAQIVANGTQAAPIVFTSQKDVLGNSSANAAGEWGGLVLAGNAFTHYTNNTYEADSSVSFGSSDHTHDTESSGTLNYVLIKHSGYEVEKDKELNGLSLAGVGSGTTLTNIAIIGGLDDGMEIWGGTVNINGLYIYNAQDDSVDTDLGYRGTIQNVLVRQVNVDSTNNHDSAGMEFGNDHNTITTDDTNATQPTITNYTAYIKGGGFYNKYDAGFKWDNVQFKSSKTADVAQIHFRGEDSYTTGAKHVNGAVCFKDNNVTLTSTTTYSDLNSKDTTTNTAYAYFVTNSAYTNGGSGSLNIDDTTACTGATEANIWKGTAGSNVALETDPNPVQ